ncbi:spore germination protein GerPC [Brevibacillus ruminantium]|uniref:Spore germination protein GerPC n=1 Tax=Brevibacillus ruminantium TaxID=2950604 RepID=A0ABY4WLD3_9BACL|nr:spore germination protein GerPC [Brevibacillus ruminantium]USG66184.1 spore germination protein GerPC [Brevibacillus ruminantium]
MYMRSDFMQYFQQLHGYLQAQCEKIEKMNQLIQQLQQDLHQMKEKQTPPPVIRNEYKFDLLKIEKLEGTLNIGLTPGGADSSIGEMDVNQTMNVPTMVKQNSPLATSIREKIDHYLTCEAPQILECYEYQYHYPLDESYRQFILDDIRKQIDQRILHYVGRLGTEHLDADQAAATEEAIVKKVKKDIDHTLEAFVKNLPKGQENA